MLKGFKEFIMRGNVVDLAAVFAFLTVAATIYFFVVVPINRLKRPAEVTTRNCPECTSEIPLAARRCPQCTAQIPSAGRRPDEPR